MHAIRFALQIWLGRALLLIAVVTALAEMLRWLFGMRCRAGACPSSGAARHLLSQAGEGLGLADACSIGAGRAQCFPAPRRREKGWGWRMLVRSAMGARNASLPPAGGRRAGAGGCLFDRRWAHAMLPCPPAGGRRAGADGCLFDRRWARAMLPCAAGGRRVRAGERLLKWRCAPTPVPSPACGGRCPQGGWGCADHRPGNRSPSQD